MRGHEEVAKKSALILLNVSVYIVSTSRAEAALRALDATCW